MQSEFYNVALDRLRYSLVWEDSCTLYTSLDIDSKDHVLVITSAGCNVLNALLKSPASVTAIDINPVQNKLLLLKKHIILSHDHATLRACMGLDGKEAVADAWQRVQLTLPHESVGYWSSFFDAHPEGLLTSGKLESYITGFYGTLDAESRNRLKQLLLFKCVQEQHDYFMQNLHDTSFTTSFIEYFNDHNLSKGRDPKLFKYADESGGEAFYRRLLDQLSSVLVSSNFYFRFFFFGPQNMPEELLPPCYKQESFVQLQSLLSRLTIVTSEAIEYLLSPGGMHINKASLSNIFEYISHEEFTKVCSSLYMKDDRQLKIVFWNLLHEQGHEAQRLDEVIIRTLENTASSQSCFYFKDVRTLENNIGSAHPIKNNS